MPGTKEACHTERTYHKEHLLDSMRRVFPKIEALVAYNVNSVAVELESPKVARGFARDDLFTVVLEHF